MDFFTSRTQYWLFDPLDTVFNVAAGFALGQLGHEYVIYTNSSGHSMSVNLSVAPSASPLAVEWMDPRSGQLTATSITVAVNGTMVFQPPARLLGADAVLHIFGRRA